MTAPLWYQEPIIQLIFHSYYLDTMSWNLIDGWNIGNMTSSKEHVSGICGLNKDGASKI